MKPLVKKSTPCYGNKNRNRNMNIRSKVVDEAFQLVHHVSFILCYTILYNFFGLRFRFGRHRAEVHRTSCALVFSLIRVRKHWWDDITQGKQ